MRCVGRTVSHVSEAEVRGKNACFRIEAPEGGLHKGRQDGAVVVRRGQGFVEGPAFGVGAVECSVDDETGRVNHSCGAKERRKAQGAQGLYEAQWQKKDQGGAEEIQTTNVHGLLETC